MLSHKEQIGKMDRLVTFKRKIVGTDESNQHKPLGYEEVASNPTVYANVEENSGSEVNQAGQVVGVTSANITIRYRTDLTIQNIIEYNSKTYDILSIIEVGRKRFLKLICESGGQYTETPT